MPDYNPVYPVLDIQESTSKQEVFDAVVTHLRCQGRPAGHYDEEGGALMCFYRTEDDLACAAGCLLTDEQAGRLSSSDTALKAVKTLKLPWEPAIRKLVSDLQLSHDLNQSYTGVPDSANALNAPETWIPRVQDALSKTALTHGLNRDALRKWQEAS